MIVERQPAQVEKATERLSALALCARAFLIFAGLYCLFFLLQAAFPYTRSGADLVTRYKHNLARHGNAFHSPSGPADGNPQEGRLHVMAFGHSKMLAGFIPSAFEADMAERGYPAIEAYNFGLPGDSRFVADLNAMAARGVAPDVALLMFTWTPDSKRQLEQESPPTPFHFFRDDEAVMDTLFPFRTLPRDVLIMLAEGGGALEMPRLYRQNEAGLAQVIADRGYYFLAQQSHYPNDQLPDGFRSPPDTPSIVKARPVAADSFYQRFAPVLAEHHIQCILIPNYFREGEFAAPPSVNSAAAAAVAHMPNVSLTGPDYWLYPPHSFSDVNHLNPRGASIYTGQLADLLAEWLKTHNPK